MTHFGCINTDQKHNYDEHDEYNELSATEIDEEKYDAIEKAKDRLEKAKEKAKMPKWLKLANLGCVAFWVLLFALLLLRDKSMSAEEYIGKNPLIAVVALVFCFVYVVIVRKTKAARRADYDDSMINEEVMLAKKGLARAYEAAGIPSGAISVDMLSFDYTEKDGEIAIADGGEGFPVYEADEMKMFEKDGRFCIFYDPYICSFDIASELKAIKKAEGDINVHILVFDWEYEKKAKLKQKNIELDKNQCAVIDGYFYLLIEQNGEEYAVYFPSYELDAIEKLTGMKFKADA